LLPRGIVGSVSHKRTVAVALVAPHRLNGGEITTLGIDVEERPSTVGASRDIGKRILTPSEQYSLQGLDTNERLEAVRLYFALKEAVYKAIDPYVHRHVRFTEVEIEPRGALQAEVGIVTVRLGLPEFHNSAPVVNAHWWRNETHVFAVASSTAESV